MAWKATARVDSLEELNYAVKRWAFQELFDALGPAIARGHNLGSPMHPPKATRRTEGEAMIATLAPAFPNHESRAGRFGISIMNSVGVRKPVQISFACVFIAGSSPDTNSSK